MHDLIGSLEVHLPGSGREALALALALVAGVWAYRRVAGLGVALGVMGAGLAAFVQIGHTAVPIGLAMSGLLLAVRANSPLQPARGAGPPFAREMLLVAGGFLLYELGRFSTVSEPGPAIRNAHAVVDLERRFGLFFEPGLQETLLRSDWLMRALNEFYSHGFLAVTAAALLWLYFADPPRYRLFRNCLAISTVLALATMAMFPVAPPRLLPGAGFADTVVTFGRDHKFANEFAAIPSLHVGWMALVGYVLSLRLRGPARAAMAVAPGGAMLVTVIATGNHYWFDGLVGAVFCIGPAILWPRMARFELRRAWQASLVQAQRLSSLSPTNRAATSFLTLGGLLLYLVFERIQSPHFTDFWGYLVFQVTATLVLLVAAEIVFAREGGLSWLTHGIAIACTYADVLGTDGNLYARVAEYDKVTHFAGVAALTAGTYDCLRALAIRRGGTARPDSRLRAAVAVGIVAGIGWEVYEYLGDAVFHTARTQGNADTAYDLVFDTLGALTLGALLWWTEVRSIEPAAPEPARLPAGEG